MIYSFRRITKNTFKIPYMTLPVKTHFVMRTFTLDKDLNIDIKNHYITYHYQKFINIKYKVKYTSKWHIIDISIRNRIFLVWVCSSTNLRIKCQKFTQGQTSLSSTIKLKMC